ncbi:MAG TPA: hypothetical protein VIO61_12845 [Anaerolineaceae bacterium]
MQISKPLSVNLALLMILALLLLSSCTGNHTPTVQVNFFQTQTAAFNSALQTATYAVPSATNTPVPSHTPTQPFTPTPNPTATSTAGPPPTLPAAYQPTSLAKGVKPVTYIKDTCEYLKARWNPDNAAPGTIVMPIMYHSVTADYRAITEDTQIRHSELEKTLKHAKEVGFQTITTRQLVDFLEKNAKIPQRSLLLIVDDRRPGVIKEHFMPFLVDYKWTLTLGWLIGDTDTRPASNLAGENFKNLWEQIEAYYATGYLDPQAHGYVHNINITESSSPEYIRSELENSRKALVEHFYCKDPKTKQAIPNCKTDEPLAYIWAGGSFTKAGVLAARQAGYKVGFTINPRGPIMYNWIPQADKVDPSSPSWIPEGPAGDPLLTLPRYWSTDAAYRIDDAIQYSKEASTEAAKNRDAELAYYQYACENITGKIPGLIP